MVVASRGVHRELLLLIVVDLADGACTEEVLRLLFLKNLDLRWATRPHVLLVSSHEDRLASCRIRMFLILYSL